jgi:radical SAM superfamily enzyme YgiQ (UPF0313 family)
MRVLLVSANQTEINMRTVPLGLGCVASALRQGGHAVHMLDLMQVKDTSSALAETIHGFTPEVIGISLRNIDNQSMGSPQFFITEANEIIGCVRSLSSAPIILGGAGYSIFPEAALNCSLADMGICGEGEEALNMLLGRLETKQSLVGIPGLCIRGKGLQDRTFVKDLDQLPLPDADLIGLATGDNAILPVQTRRGCPMDCSYCSIASIEGTVIRKRSPKKVVEWIARWTKVGLHQLYFVDNTFNLPVSYARELCTELARASLGVTWRSIIYPYKMDERLAASMAEAGCTEGSVGFESGCERILRAMNKRFRLEDVTRTCKVLRTYGIIRTGFLVLGGPGETRQSVEESLTFADSLDLDTLKITIGIRVYPHTRLTDQASREGVIGDKDDLLVPRFYLAAGLGDWITETVAAHAETRPSWIVDS